MMENSVIDILHDMTINVIVYSKVLNKQGNCKALTHSWLNTD